MADDLTAQLAKTNEQLAKLRRELREEYSPRAEQARRRRGAVLLVLVAMAGSLLVNNGAISRCFLSSPAGVERQVCGAMFIGYGHMRQQGDERLQQFTDLLRTIPENKQDVAELKARVEKLERKRR